MSAQVAISEPQKGGPGVFGFEDKGIDYEAGMHRGRPVIWLRFDYNQALITKVRASGARWSATRKCWYLPQAAENPPLPQLEAATQRWAVTTAKATPPPPAPAANKKSNAVIHAVNSLYCPPCGSNWC